MHATTGATGATAVPEVTEPLTKAQRYEAVVEAMEKMVLDAMPGMLAVQIKKANDGNNNSFQFLQQWVFGRPAKNFTPPVHYNRPSYTQMREEMDAMFEQHLKEDRYPDDAVPVISSPHFGYYSRKFGTAPAADEHPSNFAASGAVPPGLGVRGPEPSTTPSNFAASGAVPPGLGARGPEPSTTPSNFAASGAVPPGLGARGPEAYVERIGREIRELDPAKRRSFLDGVRRTAFNNARDALSRPPDPGPRGPGPLMREAVWQRREFKQFLVDEQGLDVTGGDSDRAEKG